MEFTTDCGERIFLIPQLIKWFKDNKPCTNNQMYSMHSKGKSVIAYANDELIYVMESFDEITEKLFSRNKQAE
jgi:hypothetical protein